MPDTVSFNTLMAICEPDLAMSLLAEMYAASVPRSARSYLVLMGTSWLRALALPLKRNAIGIAIATEAPAM